MPITTFQAEVLRLLSENRSPSSYLGGGVLSSFEGARFSDDLDYFHDDADATLQTFHEDRALLERCGYSVETVNRPAPGFVRAMIFKDGGALKVDWAHEAAWHFFAPIKDENVGYRLHWVDAATNKVLALASRREARDIYDALQWHQERLHLGALIWAASGKDAGLPPGMILEEIRRNIRISPHEISALSVQGEIDPVEIGSKMREAIREAEILIETLPPETLGCLFLNDVNEPILPDPRDSETLTRPMAPCEGGLIPTVYDEPGFD